MQKSIQKLFKLATVGSLLLAATSAQAALIVIDNGDAGYASTGFTIQTSASNHFDGDSEFNTAADNGGFATWTFTGLTNGTYDVFATWQQGSQSNLATLSPFSGTDGLVSTTVNQEIAPTADFQINDTDGDGILTFDFVKLGTVTVSDTNFQVRLDAVVGGTNQDFVLADAVAISHVPEPSSTALLGLGGLALILRRRK